MFYSSANTSSISLLFIQDQRRTFFILWSSSENSPKYSSSSYLPPSVCLACSFSQSFNYSTQLYWASIYQVSSPALGAENARWISHLLMLLFSSHYKLSLHFRATLSPSSLFLLAILFRLVICNLVQYFADVLLPSINILLKHLTSSKLINLLTYLFSGFFQKNTPGNTNGLGQRTFTSLSDINFNVSIINSLGSSGLYRGYPPFWRRDFQACFGDDSKSKIILWTEIHFPN